MNIQVEKIQKKSQEHRCHTGLDQVLKTCWYIVHKPDTDDRTKLQATAIINDCYKYIMDLNTNGVVITESIKYIQGKMDHLNNQEKKLLHDIKEDAEDAEAAEAEAEAEDTGEQTHNKIF